jgi:DNA primase
VYTSANGVASVFEALREEVPIGRLIESNGHRKTLCVNHSEKTPSMHVYEDHVHCYGCGFHGDVVDVWAIQKGIDRPIEAAFDLAREFNIRLPEMSEEARQKYEEHREKQADDLKAAQACHSALDKHPHVREWWEGRGFGKELQERFLLGSNRDGTKAVIPFWRRGKIEGLIHRKLEGEPKYILPNAEEFPEGYKPLFVPGPLKGEISLVEGYIDGLAVAATGKSTIAIGGRTSPKPRVRSSGRSSRRTPRSTSSLTMTRAARKQPARGGGSSSHRRGFPPRRMARPQRTSPTPSHERGERRPPSISIAS